MDFQSTLITNTTTSTSTSITGAPHSYNEDVDEDSEYENKNNNGGESVDVDVDVDGVLGSSNRISNRVKGMKDMDKQESKHIDNDNNDDTVMPDAVNGQYQIPTSEESDKRRLEVFAEEAVEEAVKRRRRRIDVEMERSN